MKELMEKLDEQNITVADYGTMSKVIEGTSLQRGIIRANEECLYCWKIIRKDTISNEKTK